MIAMWAWFQELVGGDSESKNWRGILIALLVIVVICGLVIIAVVLVTPSGSPMTFFDAKTDSKPIIIIIIIPVAVLGYFISL